MKIIKPIILSTLLVCAIGCSQSNESNSAEIAELKKQLQDLENQNEDLSQKKSLKEDINEITEVNREIEKILKTDISGSCFITIKAGSAVKLSLVNVKLYEGDITKAINEAAEKTNNDITELSKKLNTQTESFQERFRIFKDTEAEYRVLYDKAKIVWKKILDVDKGEGIMYSGNTIYGDGDEEDIVTDTTVIKYWPRLVERNNGQRTLKIIEDLIKEINPLAEDTRDFIINNWEGTHISMVEGFNSLNLTIEEIRRLSDPNVYRDIIMSHIDDYKPIISVKTDADGKFNFKIDREKLYTVVAVGQRLVGDTPEKYYWTVPLKTNQDDNSAQLFLSNDNLSSEYNEYIQLLNIEEIHSFVTQLKEDKNYKEADYRRNRPPSNLLNLLGANTFHKLQEQ
jgi:hypothetical protein